MWLWLAFLFSTNLCCITPSSCQSSHIFLPDEALWAKRHVFLLFLLRELESVLLLLSVIWTQYVCWRFPSLLNAHRALSRTILPALPALPSFLAPVIPSALMALWENEQFLAFWAPVELQLSLSLDIDGTYLIHMLLQQSGYANSIVATCRSVYVVHNPELCKLFVAEWLHATSRSSFFPAPPVFLSSGSLLALCKGWLACI